jgi:DNA-binding SARP family transcriptional activator/TolB-like protein
MFRLKLFGGAVIEGPDGPLSGRIAQRRQLALLAYLGLHAGRPVSRDRLLALLWPESSTDRARRNLADCVYLVRKALGEEAVVSAGDDLLLDPGRVETDAAKFRARLAEGDPESVVALYHGPFLDGFHLPDAPDYEDWLSREREWFARARANALEALAVAADKSGDLRGAVERWRAAAEAEPHNSRVALGLARSMAAAGDPAGAIRWAETHARLVMDEFGVEPDPELAGLAEALRSPASAPPPGRPAQPDSPARSYPPVDPDPPAEPEPVAAPEPTASPEPTAVSEPATTDRLQATPASRPPRRRVFVAGLMALVVLTALSLALLPAFLARAGVDSGAGGSATAAGLDAGVVVLAPFRTAGAAPELEYLGQGLVELLAATLGGGAGWTVVDPGLALATWTGGPGDDFPTADRARGVARSLGAGSVITGGVVGTTGVLTIHASILDTTTGETTGEAAAEGTEDSLHDLVDRLVAQLLARRAGEEEHRLAQLTSASLPALKVFLQARAAHRRGDYEAALRTYGRALDLDSTFALAGLGITQVDGWVGGSAPLAARGRAVVSRNLERLSERDRAGYLGRVAPRDPERAPSVVERLGAVDDALRRWPDHPRLWYRQGDDLMHFGPGLGLPSWERRARESFERALALDPDFAEPVHHLAVVLREMGDTAALRQLTVAQLERSPTGPVADYLRWTASHVLGPGSPLHPPPLDSMDTDATLRWIGIVAQDYGFALPDGARAVRLRLDRPGIRDQHLERREGAHAYALNGGRPGEAAAMLRSIVEVQPDPDAHRRMAILAALYADGDPDVADRAAEELAGAEMSSPIGEINRCVLAQWWLAAAQAADGATEPVALPPLVPANRTGALAGYRAICSAVAHAQHAAIFDSTAAPAAIRRLEALLAMGRHGGLVDDGHAEFAHLALARLHRAAGDADAALAAVRRRARYNGWQPYLATMLLEEASLAAATGDTAGAIRAYRHHLAFRTDPEPAMRTATERAREELEALAKRSGG